MNKELQKLKVVEWLGDSIDELRTWPKSVTEEAGTELLAVQKGRDPSNWKPMTTVGAGVREIRVAEDGDQYRVIYVAKFEEAIYVLHVITKKKTQKTTQRDLDLAKKRYKELLNFKRRTGK